MKKAMQLKARVKEMAQKSRVPAQAVLQNFMMERILERIAVSKYRDMFILKGGMLIASMIGIGSRTTMDMDATLRGFPLSDEGIRTTFEDICSIQLDDEIDLTLNSITGIRDEDEYGGYRLAITAQYEGINTPIKIDLTTGDVITPKAIRYKFPSSFEKKSIDVWAYNIETILAEKVETILRRGILNTRPRDFYDVYILTKIRGDMINKKTFFTALTATAEKRSSTAAVQDRENTLSAIQSDPLMRQRWDLYSKDNFYANDIEFDGVMTSIVEILK